MAVAAYQACAGEGRQMRRHGVLRNIHEARQLAGGDTFRLASDEQPEDV